MAPSSNRRASGTRSERERRHDGEPLGRVVQREAEHQQGAERELAEREGGADGQPLTEVVQADADGDEQCHDGPGRPGAGPGRGAAAAAQPGAETVDGEIGGDRGEQQQHRPLERARHRLGRLAALVQRVDEEEDQQPDRQGQHEVEAAPPEPPQQRVPEQADRHRQHADVEADQREDAEQPAAGARRLHRHRDLVIEGDAVAADQAQRVRLALDPGVGDAQRGAPQVRRARPRAPGVNDQ